MRALPTCNTQYTLRVPHCKPYVDAAINHFYYIQSFASWFWINFFLRVLVSRLIQSILLLAARRRVHQQRIATRHFIVIACVCLVGMRWNHFVRHLCLGVWHCRCRWVSRPFHYFIVQPGSMPMCDCRSMRCIENRNAFAWPPVFSAKHVWSHMVSYHLSPFADFGSLIVMCDVCECR